jgi:hypothetical protein
MLSGGVQWVARHSGTAVAFDAARLRCLVRAVVAAACRADVLFITS